jgi:hypothetical protein
MKHFLITRFNLKNTEWNTSRDGGQILDHAWLEHRFRLFEQYCLPSVKNQTNQNFEWYVFFDTDTPAAFMARIDAIASAYRNFRPCFVSNINAVTGYLQQCISTSSGSGSETGTVTGNDTSDHYIITSRMDNDDAIHKDYIATIQSLFVPQHGTVIDLRLGYQLGIIGSTTDIRLKNNIFNPFVSLVEHSQHFSSALSKSHKEWTNANAIITFYDKPLWIELVHERNKLNTMTDRALMLKQLDTADFGLDTIITSTIPLPLRLLHNTRFRLVQCLVNLKRRLLPRKPAH